MALGAAGPGGPVGAPATKPDPASLSAFSLEYYQSFFDVSTVDIRDRMLASVWPLGPPFFHSDSVRADLYGPFWISTTVAFLMAVTANFADYIANFNKKTVVWHYDFEKVTLAATMFYSSLLLWPAIVYMVLRRLNAGRPFVNIVALYGYSFTSYLPASVICVIPGKAASWLAVSTAFFVSTWFLVRNIYSYFLAAPVPSASGEEAEQHKNLGLLLVCGVVAVHFGIALAVKLYFFNY